MEFFTLEDREDFEKFYEEFVEELDNDQPTIEEVQGLSECLKQLTTAMDAYVARKTFFDSLEKRSS